MQPSNFMTHGALAVLFFAHPAKVIASYLVFGAERPFFSVVRPLMLGKVIPFLWDGLYPPDIIGAVFLRLVDTA
jgi:hypothetical protein